MAHLTRLVHSHTLNLTDEEIEVIHQLLYSVGSRGKGVYVDAVNDLCNELDRARGCVQNPWIFEGTLEWLRPNPPR